MTSVDHGVANGVVELRLATDPRFGGKAQGLARLMALGVNVPDGFCVNEKRDSSRHEILKAYRNLGSGLVAVRSSASCEDGISASAAGQFKSVLGVGTEAELLAGIKTCVSSVKSLRVESYFNALADEAAAGATMTVVVQRMIDSAVSGVLFTAEPHGIMGNERYCVIEACLGQGEQLVSGRVQAMQYAVDRETREISAPLPPTSLLSEAHLQTLTDEAMRAESHFGLPLDLEWAIDTNGKLHWLQARPITTLLATSHDELDSPVRKENQYFTRVNIGEMLPGAATPLTSSVFGKALNHGFRGLYGACGALLPDREQRNFVGCFFNHLFIDLTLLFAIVGRVAGTSKESLEVSLFGRPLEEKPEVEWINSVFRGVNFVRYAHYIMGFKKAIKRLEHLQNTAYISECSKAKEQYRAIDAFISDYCLVTTLHLQVSSYSGALNGALREILKRGGLPTGAQMETIASLLSNIDGIESAVIITDLEKIADAAKAEKDFFQSYNSFSGWLQDGSSLDVAPRLFSQFIKKNGHRCVREVEFSEIEWKDDLDELIRNIWKMMQLPDKGTPVKADMDLWKLAVDEVVRSFPQINNRALRAVASRARDGVRYREYTKSILIRMTSRLRRAYGHLATLLVQEGRLPSEELIFFFQHSELESIVDSLSDELISRAQSRQHWYGEHSELCFPDFCQGKPEPLTTSQTVDDALHHTGLPVSPGKVTAPVRIVRDKADARLLEAGEIMCARFTDVGWTPYYGVIDGLITEIGSSLSHGAVVAREYRLPLVSSVENATNILKNGDIVEMDGKKGTVRILERVAS